ncbi:MAG: CHRD domain-containing protein [Verrucomicrobiales bacterium]|nr:CHRD domain-containing protein [Verrucomicrobiales bacterium]
MKNLISAMAVVGCCLSAAQATTWDVTLELNGLNGGNEVPANGSTATGGGVGVGIRYDDVSNELSVNVAYGLFGFNPLTGDYQSSSIHLGSASEEGPALVDLAAIHIPVGPRSGIYSGNVTLSQAAESALLAGNLYMNINSTAFPGGEIRGQLTVVPEPGTVALGVLGLGALAWASRRREV